MMYMGADLGVGGGLACPFGKVDRVTGLGFTTAA